jgi:O-antigen/teichoic acid export membrane protein
MFLTSSKTHRPSFVVGLMTVLGGQAACAAAAGVLEICYDRLLGPAGRGQVSLCLMATYALALVAGLGGEIPISVWTADPSRRSPGWFSAVAMSGFLGTISASCLWIVLFWNWHPSFLRGITPQLAVMVLAAIPLTVALGYLTAALTGQERFRLSAGVAFASQLAELTGVAMLLLLVAKTAEMALLGYAMGLLIGAVIAAVILWEFLRSVWTEWPTRQSLAAALSLGVRGQLGNVATMFNYRLDVFIVNAFLNTAQVGIYALGVVVSESLWQIPHAASVALFPRTARTMKQGAAEFTCAVTRQVLLISCLSGLAIAAVSPLAVPLIFGAQFRPSVSVIWWILPGTVALSLAKVMSADLAGRGKPEYSSICSFLSLGVTVALDLTLIPRLGIKGAALASSVAYFVHTILVALALKKISGIRWKDLFIPTYAEWDAYKQAWLRLKLWLRPASVRTANANSDV